MRLQWDFHELTDFANRLQSSYEFDTAMMTAAKKIAQVLHKHLLLTTPVKTGNLRKMWSAGNNLMFTVETFGYGYRVTLINEARANDKKGYKYGVAVNDGHSTPGGGGWVMGRFFVEKSILLTEPSVDKIIMRELQKWWNSV